MLRHSVSEDIPGLIELWKVSFGDEEKYPRLFFDLAYREDDTFVCQVGDRIAAMASFLPCTLHAGDKSYRVSYFYALCTHPDFRRQGIASKLTKYSFEQVAIRGDKACFGFPDEEKKIAFYEHLGMERGADGLPKEDNRIEMPDYLAEYGQRLVKLEYGPQAHIPDSHDYIGVIKRFDPSIPQDIIIHSNYTFD